MDYESSILCEDIHFRLFEYLRRASLLEVLSLGWLGVKMLCGI